MKSTRLIVVMAGLLMVSLPLLAQSVSNTCTVTVSNTGSGANYTTLSAALSGGGSSCPAGSKIVILVYPGVYTGPNNGGGLRWASNVSLRGVDRDTTIIQGASTDNSYERPLIDFSDLTGVEVSNITFDGSAQMAVTTGNQDGSLAVCGASIAFTNVRIMNASAGFSPGFALVSTEPGVLPYISCSGRGNIVVKDSEIGPIYDAGGDWTIMNTHILAAASDGPDYVYAFARLLASYPGSVTIVGSKIEALATGSGVGPVSGLYLVGTTSGPEIRVIGSTIEARNLVSSPGDITAAVYEEYDEAAGSTIFAEGSQLRYESNAGVSAGQFYGVYVPEGTTAPIHIRASAIRSSGSGGTRADVYTDTNATLSIAATEYSSLAGGGATATTDLRQGQFSSDLVIPLTSPTLGPVNGQIWIDTGTNKLCYRSGGTTRCLTGS